MARGRAAGANKGWLWNTWIFRDEDGWEDRNERVWRRLEEVARRLGAGISVGDDPDIAVGFGEREGRAAVVYMIYSERAVDEFRALGGEGEDGFRVATGVTQATRPPEPLGGDE
jgi:hypothetical protein